MIGLAASAAEPVCRDVAPDDAAKQGNGVLRLLTQSRVKDACADQKTYLTKAKRLSVDQVLDEAAGKKLVIFGEGHGERSSKFFNEALRRLKAKNPELDCVLVEQPQERYQAALDACNSSDACDRSKLPYFSGVKEGLANKLKVMAIDVEVKFTEATFVDAIQKRNDFMAAATRRLLSDGSCKSAVMVIGALHAHSDPRLRSITDELAGDIPSYKVELISPGRSTFGSLDPRWNWTNEKGESLCPEIPGYLGKTFAIQNDAKGKRVPVYFGPLSNFSDSEFFGAWSDYDATILMGCEDPNATTCPVYRDGEKKLKNRSYLRR